jgi:predicted N-acyltransferase
MQSRLITSIRDVSPGDWNALTDSGYPFTAYDFLDALEQNDCVGEARGWQPAHLLLEEDGQLIGAAPSYLKYHSMGEFVFDWAWADAYRQLGLNYYPKLLSAVPFSPVTGPRLLARSAYAKAGLAKALRQQCESLGISSAHALFVGEEDSLSLERAGFMPRHDCQYHWYNDGYGDFDGFLAALSASKRKKIRRERRRVAEAGINLECHYGGNMSEALWRVVYAFYADTYHIRGQRPYLNWAFWLDLAERMGERLVIFIAYHHGEPVAAALTVRGSDTLYGRHWGCAQDYHSLHFEACYYQGIEYCIQHGLTRFDAGAQGPHKLNRGFMPVRTCSAHWVADARLREAIGDFLSRERDMMAGHMQERRRHSPYKSSPEQGDGC